MADDERANSEAWVRRPKTAHRLALRSRIVLAAAADIRVGLPTVGKWRELFLLKRLEGLADERWPGPPRAVTDAQVEAVVTRTLESKPGDATHWSTRGMARASGLSRAAVSRARRAFGLTPHPADSFKLSADPFFVEKARDPVGLDLSPPVRRVEDVCERSHNSGHWRAAPHGRSPERDSTAETPGAPSEPEREFGFLGALGVSAVPTQSSTNSGGIVAPPGRVTARCHRAAGRSLLGLGKSRGFSRRRLKWFCRGDYKCSGCDRRRNSGDCGRWRPAATPSPRASSC